MRHHSIICRLNAEDAAPVTTRPGTHRTEIAFVDGERRLSHGIGQAMDQLLALGLRPSEDAVDLALLAAVINAADTRISRDSESQDGWTREIDLYVPVADPQLWSAQGPILVGMLRFLTGDHWGRALQVSDRDARRTGRASKEAEDRAILVRVPSFGWSR